MGKDAQKATPQVYSDLTSEAAEVAPAAPSAENLSDPCDLLLSAAPPWSPSLLMSDTEGKTRSRQQGCSAVPTYRARLGGAMAHRGHAEHA